jgi:hypothetical protein
MPRRKQCEKCPWKASTNPQEIPNGYDEAQHMALRRTIAEPGAIPLGGPLRIFACHESPVGDELPCVGWLYHQLGEGQNLALRFAVVLGRIDMNVELDGPQKATFEETLP